MKSLSAVSANHHHPHQCLFSVFSAPIVVTVTVAESDENQEEDEEEEETPGHTVHYGRGDGDGDRVHHDSSLAADDLSDLMMMMM